MNDIEQKGILIDNQNVKLNEQAGIIENQSCEIQTRDDRISCLSQEISEKSAAYEALQQQLELTRNELSSVYNSCSWRITTPLRKIFTFFRRLLKGE